MAKVQNQNIPYTTILYYIDDYPLYLGRKYKEELQEAMPRKGLSPKWEIVTKTMRGPRYTFRSPR